MNLLPYNFSNLLLDEGLFKDWLATTSPDEILNTIMFLPSSMAKALVGRLPFNKINESLLGEILQNPPLFSVFAHGESNDSNEWADFIETIAEEISQRHAVFHGVDWNRILVALSAADRPFEGYLKVFRRKLLAANEVVKYREPVIVQLIQPLKGTNAWGLLTEEDIADIITWLFHPSSTEPNYNILAEIIYHPSMSVSQANRIALSPHALKEGILEHLAASPYTNHAPAVRKLILSKRSLKAFLLLLPSSAESEVIKMLQALSTSKVNSDHFQVLVDQLLENHPERVSTRLKSELLRHPSRKVRLEVQRRLGEKWAGRK